MYIRVATRKSKLALIQADIVVKKIKQEFPKAICEIVPIVTTGDKITDKNLYDIGGKALFLKELEEQLINKQVDIAVHSMKDVPGILPEGLSIAAVMEREDPRDVFISHKYKKLEDLPKGGIVGTSSVRRKVIIQKIRPDLKIVTFRGNIQTRLNKLKNGEVDATILAYAGLNRSDMFDPEYCHPISIDQMLPAAGQGMLGIEIRSNHNEMKNLCARINHIPTWHLAQAERSFLSYLEADCKTPLSAYAIYENGRIKARYMRSDFEGNFISYHTEIGDIENAHNMGILAAKAM